MSPRTSASAASRPARRKQMSLDAKSGRRIDRSLGTGSSWLSPLKEPKKNGSLKKQHPQQKLVWFPYFPWETTNKGTFPLKEQKRNGSLKTKHSQPKLGFVFPKVPSKKERPTARIGICFPDRLFSRKQQAKVPSGKKRDPQQELEMCFPDRLFSRKQKAQVPSEKQKNRIGYAFPIKPRNRWVLHKNICGYPFWGSSRTA